MILWRPFVLGWALAGAATAGPAPAGYEIVSDVDHGKITATVELPSRKSPREVVLRFRHPTKGTMKGVTINGKDWKQFDAGKETITLLRGLTGTVTVTAQY